MPVHLSSAEPAPAALPDRKLPSVKSAGSFDELETILKSLTPVLHDVIAARRAVAEPAILDSKHESFTRAFKWLRESYRQLETDFQWLSREGRPEGGDFQLYLIVRKGVECELQLAELCDLKLERIRRDPGQVQPAIPGSTPVESSLLTVDAMRVEGGYRDAVSALGRALLFLGVENRFDILEIRVRMLSGYSRLSNVYEKYSDLFDGRVAEEKSADVRKSASDLTAKIRLDIEGLKIFLAAQTAQPEPKARYIRQESLLPGLERAFEESHRRLFPVYQVREMPADVAPNKEATPKADMLTGWKALAAEHRIPEEKLTAERLWVLSPLQREVLEIFYGAPGADGIERTPVRDWGKVRTLLTAEGFTEMSPDGVRELFEFSIAHLKLFENGWHWVAQICEMPVQTVKNRFKFSSVQEAEYVLTYFGIGGPRQAFANAHDGPMPQLVTSFLDRIQGRQEEAINSLRRPQKKDTMSPRLQQVLSGLFKPETSFTPHQLLHHIATVSAFEDWSNYDAVLDLALASAKYLNCASEIKPALWAACEKFVSKIPDYLWSERSLTRPRDIRNLIGDQVPEAPAEMAGSALSRILRTVSTSDRLNYLGEVVIGMRMKLYGAGESADPAKYEQARELFITAKYTLAVGISKEFTGAALREDVIQEGIPALIAAVESFEPALGLRFSTQAYLPMKNAMKRLVQKDVRERTGLQLKTQDKLRSFERDCERAGVYPLLLEVTNEDLRTAISKVPGAIDRSIEEIKRLRSIIFLAGCAGEESGGEYVPGSKISIDSAAPLGEGEESLAIQVADPNSPAPRDEDAVRWIGETMKNAWSEKLLSMNLDETQLERDLEIFRIMHFTPRPLSAPEIAEIEGVAPQTVRRACIELREIFARKSLSLEKSDTELLGALEGEVSNPETVRRNLSMFRKASVPPVTSDSVAERFDMDGSNVRIIYRKLLTAAETLGVAASKDEAEVLRVLREHYTECAKSKSLQDAEIRMRVVERVAHADGETLESIGTSFGFGEGMVRYIMSQAREVAAALNLRE